MSKTSFNPIIKGFGLRNLIPFRYRILENDYHGSKNENTGFVSFLIFNIKYDKPRIYDRDLIILSNP